MILVGLNSIEANAYLSFGINYRSPERLKGEPYTFPCDIWSLGIIVMELATGEYPYKKTGSFLSILNQISEEKVPELPNNNVYSDEFRDFVSSW